jgi:F-type H+-transporting ATPase subunit delta
MDNITVKTAMPLSTALKNKVIDFINQKAGTVTEIEYIIDKLILGGIIIKIGDVVYDGSIKRKINKLKQNF